ncbi:hypothetical protein HYV43_00175 [Candidatus Micrarchaeota archaeon]|nr:hypothetical protein [Candidatus Micrarchaeota archaeon]
MIRERESQQRTLGLKPSRFLFEGRSLDIQRHGSVIPQMIHPETGQEFFHESHAESRAMWKENGVFHLNYVAPHTPLTDRRKLQEALNKHIVTAYQQVANEFNRHELPLPESEAHETTIGLKVSGRSLQRAGLPDGRGLLFNHVGVQARFDPYIEQLKDAEQREVARRILAQAMDGLHRNIQGTLKGAVSGTADVRRRMAENYRPN